MYASGESSDLTGTTYANSEAMTALVGSHFEPLETARPSVAFEPLETSRPSVAFEPGQARVLTLSPNDKRGLKPLSFESLKSKLLFVYEAEKKGGSLRTAGKAPRGRKGRLP